MKRFFATALFAFSLMGAAAIEKSGTIVYINGAKYYVHKVQPGETLYALAKTYETGERVIVENNPSAASGLRAGENLKIPVVTAASSRSLSGKKLRKTFDTHTVAQGETLYAISRRYEIPIRTIVADNPSLDPIRLHPGDKILIRKGERGSEDETGSREQWEEYHRSLNSVAEQGYAYHMVHAGETFYALSRRFGISEQELSALNGGLQPADLKAGAIIKVPSAETAAPAPADEGESAAEAYPAAPHGPLPEVVFHPLRAGAPLDVALLLPLSAKGAANGNYLEFYQGFLLGLSEVKNGSGRSVNATLFDTERSPEKIEQIVATDAFRRAGLIVGPVYEEGLHPVVRFAEEHAVPVVSPLAHISKIHSDALFQMASDPARKYAKVADLLAPEKEVTLIYSSGTDREFEREMLALLGGRPYGKHTYKYAHHSVASGSSAGDLSALLDNDRDNVFIILSDNETEVDRILAALASADTNITSRGRKAPRFTVLGNSRWNRYNNIDRTMFFKDRVVFVSTYHAKRDAQAVVDFDNAYIRAFGALPTLYSYRGYDAATIFVPAMYNDIQYDLEGRVYTPLQTTYRFERNGAGGNHVNRNWTRVNYHPDFTITIE